ncbi:MAG: phosphoribosylaminoimidazolesuccinocarboxamide synthase [Desulfarculales bacterium]|jgi:phosphoribosylaminoimidazole-succinocarboxamide synthase|nr:phosphoribosylaminoimidazolesuccinocarboxamide synthase [Desulfarculales bacterium]
MPSQILKESNLPGIPLLGRGKVRDIYDLGSSLLMVTTDRLSAFDVILPDPIPYKGEVLNRLSLFWFRQMEDLVPNHILSSNPSEFHPLLRPYGGQLQDRSVVVKKCRPLPIEAIVRGYISGSGWKDYLDSGKISGHCLPAGLKESQKLPRPIFTPSTKAALGLHDENISVAQAEEMIGLELAGQVADLSIAVYERAASVAAAAGIIIADTKLEFGLYNGELTLIDEALTPDSSRFWPGDDYEPGRTQKSFDKQYVRDYLESVGFAKKPPAPHLPPQVIAQTSRLYVEALHRLSGIKIDSA